MLPGTQEGQLWPAIGVVTALSACGPPMLLVLSRTLDIPRFAGLLASLALAAWPLHSALSASDLLAAPTVSITLTGLALAFAALRRDQVSLLLPAAAVLAWVLWCCPEGVLALPPVAVAGGLAIRRWPQRWEVWVAVSWLSLSLAARVTSLFLDASFSPVGWGIAGDELGLFTSVQGGHAAFPWWFWLGIPMAFPGGLRGRRILWMVIGAGLAGAALASFLNRLGGDRGSVLQSCAFGMPWLALMAGTGLAAFLAWIPRARLKSALLVLLAAGMVLVPTLQRDWLERRYSAATSDLAFRRALKDVQMSCVVVVQTKAGVGGREDIDRFRLIAALEQTEIPGEVQETRIVDAAALEEGTGDPSSREFGCWYAFTVGDAEPPEGFRSIPLAKYCDDCTLSLLHQSASGPAPKTAEVWDLDASPDAQSPTWIAEDTTRISNLMAGFQEILPFSWQVVRFYAGGPLPIRNLLLIQIALGATLLLVLHGGGSTSGGFLSTPRLFAPALGLLVASGVAFLWWWLGSNLPEISWESFLPQLIGDREMVFRAREFAVVSVFLGSAIAGLVVAAAMGIRWVLRHGMPRAVLWTVGLAFLVLGVSLLVRLGFTEPNVFTDGGTGHERVLDYGPGYGGLCVMVPWFLPAHLEGQIWPAVRVLTILSGLAPVSLFLLALGAGLGRPVALLSGLTLACWPLHAALYSSDFLNGGNLTLTLTGLAFAVGALRLDRAWLLLPAACVLSYSIWGRPEAPLHLLPTLVPGVLALRRWGHRFETWAGVGWVGLALAALLFSFVHRPERLEPVVRVAGLFVLPWEGVVQAGFAAFPWWLLLGFPLGAALAPRPYWVSFMVLGGFASGALPVFLGGMPEDLLEGFRYGTPVAAWFALVSGAGLHWLVVRLPTSRLRSGGLVLIAAAVCMTPLFHLEYLATPYGPRSTDIAFRKALRRIPSECGVVVPGEDRHDGLDPAVRYDYIAVEEWKKDPDLPSVDRIVGAQRFLAEFRGGRGLPRVSSFAMDQSNPVDGNCWYFFSTGECLVTQGNYSGSSVTQDPGSCRALEAAVDMEPLETFAVGFRCHRLVSVPRVRELPRHAPDFPTRLFRVQGVKPGFPPDGEPRKVEEDEAFEP